MLVKDWILIYTSRKKQVIKPLIKEISQIKPRVGQGRAGSRWKKSPINQLIDQSAEHSQTIPKLPKIHTEVIYKPNFTTLVQSIKQTQC